MENKPQLPTRWLFFYTYILLPFNIFFSFGLPLAEQEKLLEQGINTQINPIVFVPIIIGSIFASFVIYGLHKRHLWGWKYNWVLLVGTALMGPMSTAPDIGAYIVAIILLSVTYLLPNYIYFKKRRYLFDPLAAPGSPTKIPWTAVAATMILILALIIFFQIDTIRYKYISQDNRLYKIDRLTGEAYILTPTGLRKVQRREESYNKFGKNKGMISVFRDDRFTGTIDVSIDGVYAGELDRYFPGIPPECGQTGMLNKILEAGAHRLYARNSDGMYWESTIYVEEGKCRRQNLQELKSKIPSIERPER